mmetsp:Transcript_12936/g.27908  ORF Transcript_12936/g.27908 Transcript_12936/m.27908 type:complete len:93 (+) Transcript_12936:136-414(+)
MQSILAKPGTRQREARAELGQVLRKHKTKIKRLRYRISQTIRSKGLSARAETRGASGKETSKDESEEKESEPARAESRKGLDKNSKVRTKTR